MSANVWLQFANIQGPLTNELEEWRTWLYNNINSEPGGFFSSVLVIVLLWKLWLACNRTIFDNVTATTHDIVSSSSLYAHEITQNFLASVTVSPRPVRLIS